MRFWWIIVLCSLWTCNVKEDSTVQTSFYHWKQDFSLGDYELDRLTALNVQRMYVRFFDVDWQNGRPLPLSIVHANTSFPESVEIVPVIFITNRTILKSDESEIEKLAGQITRKLFEQAEIFSQVIPEVQIDCDWSGKSRDRYFNLLQVIRTTLAERNIKLSATIRLHQIKYYQRTGVPEVDRGALMFYNTGTVDDPATTNSILDLSTAKSYFENFENYPLPLDVALPIFRWGVVFQGDRFVRLINGLNSSLLQDSSRFMKVGENQFELRKSMYIEGYYLYKGDRIRTEEVKKETLLEAASLLASELKPDDRHLIFYHLDSTLIANYPHEVLETICRSFD